MQNFFEMCHVLYNLQCTSANLLDWGEGGVGGVKLNYRLTLHGKGCIILKILHFHMLGAPFKVNYNLESIMHNIFTILKDIE